MSTAIRLTPLSIPYFVWLFGKKIDRLPVSQDISFISWHINTLIVYKTGDGGYHQRIAVNNPAAAPRTASGQRFLISFQICFIVLLFNY